MHDWPGNPQSVIEHWSLYDAKSGKGKEAILLVLFMRASEMGMVMCLTGRKLRKLIVEGKNDGIIGIVVWGMIIEIENMGGGGRFK